MSGHNLPRIVLIASTVGWLLGGLFLLISLAVAVPGIAAGASVLSVALPIAIGVAYSATGYLLRKGRQNGAMIGIVASAIFLVLLTLGSGGRPSPGMVMHLLFLGLCVGARRSLGEYRKAIDADAAASRPTVVR